MTEQTPPDWVLIEAAKRANHNLTPARLRAGLLAKAARPYFDALCDMILRHEQPPVDRKILCAREAIARVQDVSEMVQAHWREGRNDNTPGLQWTVRAIELWEEGYGK
jgi:hypothetical protein